jgi:two-component system sensor histidine kinase BaeS
MSEEDRQANAPPTQDPTAAREAWRSRRAADSWSWEAGRGPWGRRGPWGPRRGFGCLFFLLFLVVAGSLVAGSAFVLSHFGGFPAVVLIFLVILALAIMARTLGRTARTLDRLVDATRRVEAGDYSVRVSPEVDGLPSARTLATGFDTMVARLETDERQRRSLLADVSHELRTPMAVVQGNLEAILDGVYPADSEHLGAILEETRVLARLIDDLRTLALSEAGTLALHREPTDPDVIVGEVLRSFEASATAAGITLSTAIEGDLPILDADPVRLREVLANLVANAIRHTPSGGRVTIKGSLESGGRWLRLEVSDTGAGIDPALLPHVFDRFVKGDASRGSGLGLAIARQLTEAHGGEISARSVVGQGTTIQVRLPLTGG